MSLDEFWKRRAVARGMVLDDVTILSSDPWEEHRRGCMLRIALSDEEMWRDQLFARVAQRNVDEWPDTREVWAIPECVHAVRSNGVTTEIDALCGDGNEWSFSLAPDGLSRTPA